MQTSCYRHIASYIIYYFFFFHSHVIVKSKVSFIVHVPTVKPCPRSLVTLFIIFILLRIILVCLVGYLSCFGRWHFKFPHFLVYCCASYISYISHNKRKITKVTQVHKHILFYHDTFYYNYHVLGKTHYTNTNCT